MPGLGANTLERVTVEKTMMLLAVEFGRLGVGRVRLNEFLTESTQRWSENPLGMAITWARLHERESEIRGGRR